MSWNVSIPLQPRETFLEALNKLHLPAADGVHTSPQLLAQSREQLAAAVAATLTLMAQTHAFGHEDGYWAVSLGGHANHDGAGDSAGYSRREFITFMLNHVPANLDTPQHALPDSRQGAGTHE